MLLKYLWFRWDLFIKFDDLWRDFPFSVSCDTFEPSLTPHFINHVLRHPMCLFGCYTTPLTFIEIILTDSFIEYLVIISIILIILWKSNTFFRLEVLYPHPPVCGSYMVILILATNIYTFYSCFTTFRKFEYYCLLRKQCFLIVN